MRTSFAARIRWLVVAICLGLGLSVLAAFKLLSDGSVEDTARGDVRTVAAFLGSMLRGRGQLLASLTDYASKSPRVFNLVNADAATVQDVVPSLREDLGVDGLLITDRLGNVLGSSGFHARMKGAKDPGTLAAESGKTWQGVLERDGDLMVASSAPLKIGGIVHGTLSTYLRLDNHRAEQLKGAGPLDLAFVHAGKVTANSLKAPLLMVSGDEPWTTTVNGKDYVAAYSAFTGSLASADAGFVVLRPLEQTRDRFRAFSVAFLMILGSVCLIAVLGGSVFGTSIARSLDAVVQAAAMLKRGEWPERLKANRRDEIGLLEETFNDMAEALRRSQDRLLGMIDSDPLTEAANHRHFKECLETEAARTTAEDQSLAMLLVDIDHFGAYNERHGHAAGDQLLKDVAQAIRAEATEFATIGRYGGDQFAVLLPGGTVANAKNLYARLRARLDGIDLHGGCAELESAKGRSDGLLVAAELALIRSKQGDGQEAAEFGGEDMEDPTRLYRTLHNGTYAAIKALAAAVDAKDPYTNGHSDRVARFAADLAIASGASEDEVDLVLRCGALHDVGKIGVPDAILQKPSRLDPEETRVMQSHPVLGEFIVGKVPQLAGLLPGVRHHHERYDGQGYPDGLEGEQIPKIARYLAIADTFDAMTSDRPYRKGLPIEVALDEIERNAGTQFDPALAQTFARIMRQRLAAGV